jgi:enamine deaminase RidA (YjgF/YER057c/UK114 family)
MGQAEDMTLPEYANPPGVHVPQASYHHVAKVGDLLFVSGQLGIDIDGQLVGMGDAEAQARQCWANLEAICAAYGVSLRHIAKTTTYITHWAYRPQVAAARAAALGDAPSPANTLVVVAGLADPSFLVEIEAVIALGR